jgi:hypothetical protein
MSISTVTSEALQLKLRQLLPSQQGFGTDLSASDTIIPVIDLTRAAEGSDVSEYLQTALAFGSVTNFKAANGTDVIANTAGFYRIFGAVSTIAGPAPGLSGKIQMSDGTSTKDIYEIAETYTGTSGWNAINFDFTVFLASGESISAISSVDRVIIAGCSRQVADVNGELTNPVGFTPQ